MGQFIKKKGVVSRGSQGRKRLVRLKEALYAQEDDIKTMATVQIRKFVLLRD